MHHDSPRNISSKKQGFHSDRAWAHWEYSPDEWAVFDRIDWQMVRLRYWLLNLVPPVGVFILGITSSPNNLAGVMLGTIAFGIPFATIPFFMGQYAYREAKKRHQARQNRDHPQRVTFAKEGVWVAGTFFPLGGRVFESLRSVRMTSQPAVLHFRCRTLISRNAYVYYTLHVPVPRGHEEEAVELMGRFRMEVIETKKQATYNPPEPI